MANILFEVLNLIQNGIYIPNCETFHLCRFSALLDCEQYETRSKDYSRFIPINHLTNVPSVDGYITRFPLFILGNQDARVVFSDVESPNWETNKGYEFGKFCKFFAKKKMDPHVI